jgi:hypothetical protein
MFFVPLFQYQLKNWEEKKNVLLEHYKNINENGMIEEVQDLIQTSYFAKENYLNCLPPQIFSDEIGDFLSEIEFDNYRIRGCWFEKSLKNGHHRIHNHGANAYSAICYVNYDETKHRPTNFISPFNNFLNSSVIEYEPNDVKSGTLIFFPSTISHYSRPNTSDEERLILSFNICPF